MCCFNLKQPVEGMEYIDVALNMEPSFRGAILQKGMLHIQLNENKEAEDLFQRVLDISPDEDQSEILYNIANSYFFLQMFPETIKWCEKITKQYPEEQKEALYLISCSYFNLSDIETCMKYLSQIWKLSDNRFEEDFLTDKRFIHMFSCIEQLLNNNQNNK